MNTRIIIVTLIFIWISQKAKLLIEHFLLTSYFIIRLIVKKIYLAIDKNGNRPVFGDNQKFQKDKNFKDYILFYEYFHGDNGKGLGVSYQTGWTGLIAKLLHPRDS